MMKSTVLIGAGDRVTRLLMTATVQDGDRRVLIEAATIAEVLQLADEFRPSVVILDGDLSRDDELHLARALARSPLTSGAAIIVLCNDIDHVDHAEVLACGINACLSKPFSPLELAKMVGAALNQGCDAA